jgi:hypothetical protein
LVGVLVAVLVRVGVLVAVRVGVLVAVLVAVLVGVLVDVLVAVLVGVLTGVLVGVAVKGWQVPSTQLWSAEQHFVPQVILSISHAQYRRPVEVVGPHTPAQQSPSLEHVTPPGRQTAAARPFVPSASNAKMPVMPVATVAPNRLRN